MKRKTVRERFFEKTNKTDTCWLWTGAQTNAGRVQMRIKCVKHYVPRISWELHNGSIPEGMLVLHKCDNPICVNPEHLFIGTHRDNMADRGRKNRQARQRGEAHGGSKLTKADVAKVFELRKQGYFQYQIGALLGCGQTQISRILRGTRWRHLAYAA